MKGDKLENNFTMRLQKWSEWACNYTKYCKIRLSVPLQKKVALGVLKILATTLVVVMPNATYAEVIKRNTTASPTSADTSVQFSNKYSLITDRAILPVLYSNWRATYVNSWYFYGDDGSVRTGWVYDNGWYYLSTEDEGTVGLMRYGWYQDSEGSWYFLNTVHDGTFGRAISGWQWVDGYSYYFDSNCKLVSGCPRAYQD